MKRQWTNQVGAQTARGSDIFPERRWAWRFADERAGLLIIGIVTVLAAFHLLRGGMLVGQDSSTQFYPWYSYLGEVLRSGEFPGWNAAQFSGAPFAGDPQSGWTYLPAMVIFTLLPLSLAAPVFVLSHLLLAAVATYLLGRVLGMPIAAASVAAVAYELTGPVFGRSVCCPAALEVATWVPAALLGVELALQACGWTARLGGWTIAGLAISQVLAAWLGQGSYYLLLVVGSFMVYRSMVSGDRPESFRARVGTLGVHGAAVLLIGFGLAAAGMLPRFAYVARSNVASGEYEGQGAWAAVVGGATKASAFDQLFEPRFYYPGVTTLALAVVAIVLARGRYAAPYFLFLSVVGVALAIPRTTVLHEVLYATLPRFEDLHRHWPERVMLVVIIAPAMLAGAAVSELARRVPRWRWERAWVAVPIVAIVGLSVVGAGVPGRAIVLVVVATLIAAAAVFTPSPVVTRGLLAGLMIVVAADLLIAAESRAAQESYGGFHRLDIDSHFDSPGAADFLREATAEEPGRFFGYDPTIATVADGFYVPYRYQFADPMTRELLVNNRATLYGLEDVQGYNPVQPKRYVEYMTALNGHGQEYHDANVFEDGLESPLLDLLNVRYIVIPADLPPDRFDLRDLQERHSTVYSDEHVRVLENNAALPRAWIVHSAVQVPEGDALGPLTTGTVDPRTTAVLEESPPELEIPTRPGVDRVHVTSRSHNRTTVTAEASAAGLVVLSEMFDPDWIAYIDGEAVTTYVANHILRAVAVPAGLTTIEFRYELQPAYIGAAISAGTIGVLSLAFVMFRWDLFPRRRRNRSRASDGRV